jgi:phosphoribosylglycinamide formyltransferase-1
MDDSTTPTPVTSGRFRGVRMTFRFGWFSTGRDLAARQLLQAARERMQDGFIKGEMAFVFCDRERGEAEQSDLFLDLVKDLGLEVITLSSRRFLPELRQHDREQWRTQYHQEIMERIVPRKQDVIVLAGYMLIVSPEMCRRYSLINLHPALPGGPTGAWEEVIEELILGRAETTGAMMHLVTPDLDRGPVISYYAFSIQGGTFAPLWGGGRDERGPLFWLIRQEGVRREIPLLILTLQALAEGRIRIEDKKVLNSTGNEIEGLSLTWEVEEYLRKYPETEGNQHTSG